LPVLFAIAAFAAHATWLIGLRVLRVATTPTLTTQVARHA